MIMYEPDPDVTRWGLHLIDVCSITDNGSPNSVTYYQNDYCRTESVKEGYCEPIVENDEVIAQTLQEELARIEAAESSGYAASGEEYQKESILAQDWLGPSKRHYNISMDQPNLFQRNEQETDLNEGVRLDLEELSMGSGDQNFCLEIENESAIDGELGKRLSQMVPLPHVPKINGEIPSADEATTDHERLLNRLDLYELVELKISGDGNCQFRSLSDQIYRSSEHHKVVREQVVNQLKSRPDLYANYVPMAYNDYMKKMSKNGEWGDHVTLQAAADSYGVKIFMITSFKDTCYIEILPHSQKSDRTIFLSFWAEVHYNSIYPLGELPVKESKKKKSWWR